MPSVGMRRSTRVLVVKGGDGARVLRSGRRLWPDSDAGRLQRAAEEESVGGGWPPLKSGQGGSGDEIAVSNYKANGWVREASRLCVTTAPVVAVSGEAGLARNGESELRDCRNGEQMWGLVYQRKRKAMELSDGSGGGGRGSRIWDDKMYGKHFVRRQRRMGTDGHVVVRESYDQSCRVRLVAVVNSRFCEPSLFDRFLASFLGHATRGRLRLRDFAAFLTAGAVHEAFASHGIRFSRVLPTSRNGICKFFGNIGFLPLFSLDFCAAPHYFLRTQINMALRSRCPLFEYVIYSTQEDRVTEIDAGEEDVPCVSSDNHVLGTEGMISLPTSSPLRSPSRNSYRRNGLISPVFQTKRRSRRMTRVGIASKTAVHRSNENLISKKFCFQGNHCQYSAVLSDHQLRNSAGRMVVPHTKELRSTLVNMGEDIVSTSCSANILVSEPNRCYRQVGAVVMLEFSASNEWVIAVKSNGSLKYSHVAQKVMRPSTTTNRYTHAMIWTGEDDWKLEFPNRKDWFVFKELYRECSDRNMQIPAAKIIPVPGVWEVPGYGDSSSACFLRPGSYIISKDDEISRAMAKRTAIYDLDSEDEEWVRKFNCAMCLETDLKEEAFELIIDALEKAQFCSPDDYSDEEAAIDLCLDLERREVVEAIYRYWMAKRKQKRSALIKIFQQWHQPKRAQLIPKPFLRKRRSLKRQGCQPGRGKQLSVLQAIAAQHDALEEQRAMLRVEEAKTTAARSVEFATRKRRRAQDLLEQADLKIYRATKALKIIEVLRSEYEDADAVVATYIDDD